MLHTWKHMHTHTAKHMYSRHTNKHRHTCTHSTNEDGNLAVSLLSSPSVSLPSAVTKSKKFEVLSFILSQYWTVPASQAIKHKVILTIISVPLFSSSEHSVVTFTLSSCFCSFQVSSAELSPIDDCQKRSFLIRIYEACAYWSTTVHCRGRQRTVVTMWTV